MGAKHLLIMLSTWISLPFMHSAPLRLEGILPQIEAPEAIGPVVSILRASPARGTFGFLGTGVLLSDSRVLTAAHSLAGVSLDSLIVSADLEMYSLLKSARLHPEYPENPAADLAIIELSTPITSQLLPNGGNGRFVLAPDFSTGLFVFRKIDLPRFDGDSIEIQNPPYLTKGHSGSPLFLTYPDGSYKMEGIFISQTFSPDRSAPTIYHFARVEDVDYSSFVPIKNNPDSRSLHRIPSNQRVTSPFIYDKDKCLASISFIATEKMSVSIDWVIPPRLIQVVSIRDKAERNQVSLESECVDLAADDVITFYYKIPKDELESFASRISVYLATPPPK